MSTIKSIKAREILDSRGNPTIRTEVELENGTIGEASVPSGASTGVHEAHELRDGGDRYFGKGVKKAVKNINTEIEAELQGMKITNARAIDETMIELDGTESKERLGANAILSVSLAAVRAGANYEEIPLYEYLRNTFELPEQEYELPIATMNILNGGEHADNNLTCQEFMIVPNVEGFSSKVRVGSEIFHTLKKILAEKGLSTGVGDEGGFAPNLDSNEEAIKLILEAIETAEYEPDSQVELATDIAAGEFYSDEGYKFYPEQSAIDEEELMKIVTEWNKNYPFVSIEDPLDQDAWEGWQKLTQKIGSEVDIVGDDLFVTNTERLQRGIDMGVANSILIKVNQIGSLSEAIDAIYLAKDNDYKTSVSHRSGETADTFIADLAVAVNSEYIKTGSLSRSERVEKYNRLMKIEQEI
ncbi:MAG: phosphopyruvate hydratase [Parcubacteria group bacterium QH_9_35_7]|nr:MAG: phosphopyruvate hydratase [Parcubacteria group bacterium QH_9_35_7]